MTDQSIKEVSAQEAHELVQSGTVLVDVRTEEEFLKGHVEGAINVPVKLNKGSDMVSNPDFEAKVAEAVPDKSASIVCSCYAGRRGAAATERLQSAGFTAVSNLIGGMGTWSEAKLPGLTGGLEPPANH